MSTPTTIINPSDNTLQRQIRALEREVSLLNGAVGGLRLDLSNLTARVRMLEFLTPMPCGVVPPMMMKK